MVVLDGFGMATPRTIAATATFAPLSTVPTASVGEAEPRFLDTSGSPKNIVTIIRCTTTLLFPFVTNQAGFDTGIAISNTSDDWIGTDPQRGSCEPCESARVADRTARLRLEPRSQPSLRAASS